MSVVVDNEMEQLAFEKYMKEFTTLNSNQLPIIIRTKSKVEIDPVYRPGIFGHVYARLLVHNPNAKKNGHILLVVNGYRKGEFFTLSGGINAVGYQPDSFRTRLNGKDMWEYFQPDNAINGCTGDFCTVDHLFVHSGERLRTVYPFETVKNQVTMSKPLGAVSEMTKGRSAEEHWANNYHINLNFLNCIPSEVHRVYLIDRFRKAYQEAKPVGSRGNKRGRSKSTDVRILSHTRRKRRLNDNDRNEFMNRLSMDNWKSVFAQLYAMYGRDYVDNTNFRHDLARLLENKLLEVEPTADPNEHQMFIGKYFSTDFINSYLGPQMYLKLLNL